MIRREGSAKSLLAAGLAVTAVVALVAAPAGATIKSSAINCSANIPLLGSSVSLTQPSNTHVTGPAWVAQGAAFAITVAGGQTSLPATASGTPILEYRDVVTKARISGQATTTVSTTPTLAGGFANDGFYYFDDDVSDATPPVKMDGIGGHPAAPTVVIAAVTSPVLVPGEYNVTVTLDPGAGTLDIVDGPAGGGGAVYAPDIIIGVTNAGGTDGPISYVGASTSLTATVLAPGIDAITNCAPSAVPYFTAQVQTNGDPAVADAPVFACKPSANTAGSISDSKGWWSMTTPASATNDFGGSMKGGVLYDGCVVPDQKVDAWQGAKTGAPAGNAVNVNTADIKFKGKQFGNCTQVDLLTPAGRSWNADSANAYPIYGSVQAKFNDTKVKGPQAIVGGNLVVDSSGYSPLVFFEAVGTVSKGTGVGGSLYFLAELDTADSDVTGIIDCNSPGYAAPAVGLFYGKGVLPIKTGPDAILSVTLP